MGENMVDHYMDEYMSKYFLEQEELKNIRGFKVVSFKVRESFANLIEYYANKMKMTKSEFIRRAIREYIERHGCRTYITRRVKVLC